MGNPTISDEVLMRGPPKSGWDCRASDRALRYVIEIEHLLQTIDQ